MSKFLTGFLPGFLGRIAEKLNLRKPRPSYVTKEDEVWLFDNFAFQDPKNNTWSSEFIAAYFRRDSGQDIAEAVSEVARIIGLADDDVARNRVAERLEPFINVIQSQKLVDIEFEKARHQANFTLGPSLDRGVSFNTFTLPGPLAEHRDGDIANSTAVVEGQIKSRMRTKFANPEGWGIISDIDDTIKVSEVRDRIKLLRHTFADEFKYVTGMPELYSHLTSLLSPIFFYLSASPYNLQPFLSSWLDQHFPQGQLVLRDMSWMELESFIVSLTMGTEKFKVGRMEKMHSWFPNRKMICIGDSTQKDPEAYAAIARKYPGWIKGIYIRVVEGVDVVAEKDLNSDERFEKAFKGLPKGFWRTFRDPKDVEQWVNELVVSES